MVVVVVGEGGLREYKWIYPSLQSFHILSGGLYLIFYMKY